jgi:ParB-like chromosome segregation protein Spo0J
MDVLKEHKKIKVGLLKNNDGQFIDKGIPKNPRVINKDNFQLLLDSLKESDLTQIRPLDVLKHGDDFVVLSGNQRLRALKKLKIKEVPCNILRDDLEPKIYRQIVMQANTNYGEWNHDDLANEWTEEELSMWGYDLPEIDDEELAPVEVEEEKPLYLKVEGDQKTLMTLVDELNAKGVTVTVKS